MNHVLLYDYDVCQELVMESDTEKNHSQNLANEEIYSENIETNIPICFFSFFPARFYSKFPHSQEDKKRGNYKKIYTNIFSYQTLMV